MTILDASPLDESESHTMQQQSYFSDLQLANRYQVNRTTIWRWVARNYLPRPVQLSPGTTRWRRDEIESHEAQHRTVEPARAVEQPASSPTRAATVWRRRRRSKKSAAR